MTVRSLAQMFALGSLLAGSAYPLATASPTMLPLAANLPENEKDLIKEIIGLEVYQDNIDKKQYYYIPPFNIRQYNYGAAGFMPHTTQVKHYIDAQQLIKDRNKESVAYTSRQITRLQEKIDKNKEDLKDARLKLAQALESNAINLINYWKINIEEYTKELAENKSRLIEAEKIFKDGGSLWPLGLRRDYDRQIVYELAVAGFAISIENNDNIISLDKKINDAMRELAGTYGGILTINSYAGFTKQQLDSLRTYVHKYYPALKISLMPMEKLTFFSLTNLDKSGQKNKSGQNIFTNIIGAGDYLGAAITLDTSVIGSMAMSLYMGPFILPVGINGTRQQKAQPFDAELDCDFSNGFTAKGRADIRNGALIFANDITNNIKVNDFSNGNCFLKLNSGDANSAELKAMEVLQSQFEQVHLYRSNLSQQEKNAYFSSILNDLNNNRQKNSRYEGIATIIQRADWRTMIIEAISRAADFHWHTNIQDVSNISNLKFHKHIKLNGDESITKAIGTNLCLVYNSDRRAYDRCTEAELIKANNMEQAEQEAQNSPECADITDPYKCGELRLLAGRGSEVKRQHEKDALLAGAL